MAVGMMHNNIKRGVYAAFLCCKTDVWSFAVFSGEVGEGFGVACEAFAADHLFGVE